VLIFVNVNTLIMLMLLLDIPAGTTLVAPALHPLLYTPCSTVFWEIELVLENANNFQKVGNFFRQTVFIVRLIANARQVWDTAVLLLGRTLPR